MSIKKVYYEIRTTGINPKKHSIYNIAGVIEVDGECVEEFNIHTKPHPKAVIDPEALEQNGVTQEQILSYPDMGEAHKKLTKILRKFIDPYTKDDKAWLVGFNNRAFDDVFLRAWFAQNKDDFFGSYFWSDSRDALVTASEYLESRRTSMPNFKLTTVAESLGIPVESDPALDDMYEVHLMRLIYLITTGRELEI